MISSIISRLVILLFGTLYPAYASYKAVKTKNIKEYVKWMMYWIVFALFTSAETFTDVFLSWFPFYYELKVVIVIWLLSPATRGSSLLYRKFVHPMLSSREQEIDDYITKAKEQSYKQVLGIGQKGVTVLMQTALKSGGGLVNQLRKSYSLSDLSEQPHEELHDETDQVSTRLRRNKSPHRSSTTGTSSIYFPEIDVRSQQVQHVQSIDDLSSGYSSGEALSLGQSTVKIQARVPISGTGSSTGGGGGGSLTRSRSNRVTRSTSTSVTKRISDGEVSDDESETFDTNIIFLNDKCERLTELSQQQQTIETSTSENEFFDTLDKLHDVLEVETRNNNSCPNLLTACRNVNRGGKYNKKTAPKPPAPTTTDEIHAVTGTLTLKPGIVKTTRISDDKCKEIFFQAPKIRRKIKRYFISKNACSTVDFPSGIDWLSRSVTNLNNPIPDDSRTRLERSRLKLFRSKSFLK